MSSTTGHAVRSRGALLSVVRFWHDQVGRDKLPPGIVALRDALADEFSRP